PNGCGPRRQMRGGSEHMATPGDDLPLLSELSGGILTLTLNRPHVRNAIDTGLRLALLDALDRAASEGARVIVLRGAGLAFCAGADTRVWAASPPLETIRLMRISIQRVLREVLEHPLPVIAAVQGGNAGFGVSLALAADVCIMADDARFVPA